MSTQKLALVTGVGPGTGTAIVRRLVADGFKVAMIARNAQRLEALRLEIPNTYAFAVDVTDTVQLDQVLDQIQQQLGAVDVLVHNAVGALSATS